jgi:hypothetical protein
MQPLRAASLALALLLPLAACGGGSTDPKALTQEGQSALQGGDYAQALERFDAAAEVAPESEPTWLQARLGSIRAQAHGAPEAAKDSFLTLAQKVGDRLKIGDYTSVASELASVEGGIAQAAYVADAAKKAFPDQAKKVEEFIQKLIAQAKASGDAAGLGALKGLGYIGGGD